MRRSVVRKLLCAKEGETQRKHREEKPGTNENGDLREGVQWEGQDEKGLGLSWQTFFLQYWRLNRINVLHIENIEPAPGGWNNKGVRVSRALYLSSGGIQQREKTVC